MEQQIWFEQELLDKERLTLQVCISPLRGSVKPCVCQLQKKQL